MKQTRSFSDRSSGSRDGSHGASPLATSANFFFSAHFGRTAFDRCSLHSFQGT